MTNWATTELHGWGRYPTIADAIVARPERLREVLGAFRDRGNSALLAHGLGRSYGDAALLRDGKVLLSRRLDRMLAFDPETGWLRVESGVSLKEIIDTFLPRGFFPPVVPGTQFVTVGGAVGCNVHGKSHKTHGCFADHIRNVEILTGRGEVVVCDRDQEPELFWATVGGMGLTGVILSLEMQLIRVQSAAIEQQTTRVESLDEFFHVFRQPSDYPLTMGWIDCVKTGAAMGRGIYMAGRHAEDAPTETGSIDRLIAALGQVVDGKDLESNLWVNPLTMRMFVEAYFRKEPTGTRRHVGDYAPFFFPLDAVPNWNYMYGKRGFLQYQFVADEETVRRCLAETARSGHASFLTVIKEFGDSDHGGLSFPRGGITLAIDFANSGGDLLKMLDRLDAMVIEAGGRVYLGKDARLSRAAFRAMYPEWEKWKDVRDAWDPDHIFQSDLGRRLGLSGTAE